MLSPLLALWNLSYLFENFFFPFFVFDIRKMQFFYLGTVEVCAEGTSAN
jgi:hypothetical protein